MATISERLVAVLETLKEKAGCRTDSIKNIVASINRKERIGKLPKNKGYAFAAQHAKSALWAARLAGYPCRSEFAERYMESAVSQAESWLKQALS